VANIPSVTQLRRQTRPASEATLARGAAIVLWALVILAGFGGLSALVRTTSDTSSDDAAPQSSASDEGRWIAAGFAERYVGAYLLAGADGATLVPFLGYSPELPVDGQPAEIAAPIRTVSVERAASEYWAVTVSVGPPGQERFWRAAVDVSGKAPVAVGLPAVVAAPTEVERIQLDLTLGPTPTNDPSVDTVTGFLGAYLCGQGDLSRYLRPGLDLTPTTPPVCTELTLTRWGTRVDDPDHQTVVVDAALGAGEGTPTWHATYAAALARRDGRWEIAELLPAAPRDGDD
jgi:hypothetical protein